MYCIQCGVKLADSEKKCPLCGIRVYHPDLEQPKGEKLYPKNRYPDEQTLASLDEAFTAKNLSPGGTADLLSATYFLHFLLQLPSFMSIVALGAIFALVVVTLINLKWKISAHLTGIGGLLGGVCSFALYYSTLPLGLILTILAASLILMYARLYLHAHTPLQVVCGLLLGLLSTFIPNLIIHYA